MKSTIKFFALLFLFFSPALYAQANLVPNPGFENYTVCPTAPDQLQSPWYSPNKGTPDYFNICSSVGFGIPNNKVGWETAHGGNAYAGIDLFAISPGISDSGREYIEVNLNTSLITRETYCVTFFVSLADSLSKYAVNKIGAYFSSFSIGNPSTYSYLPYVPQIENNSSNPLTNMIGWTKVSGQFIASGGEKFLTIGNFNNNINSDTVFIRNPSSNYGPNESYYYIDDISVIQLIANAGKDSSVCSSPIVIGSPSIPGFTYSWQPASGLSDPNIAQPSAFPLLTTTYTLTVTTSEGCSKSDTVTISVLEAKAGRDTIICSGASVSIGDLAAIAGNNYSWLPSSGLQNPYAAQTIATPTGTTSYTLTVSNSNCTKKDTVNITALPYIVPSADAGANKTICYGDTVSLGSFQSGSNQYSWFPAYELSDAKISDPLAFPKQTSTYYLTVSDTNSTYLCKKDGKDSVTITVEDCDLFIPNIFTPNGDGINDLFLIEKVHKESEIFIYNRWGILVFQSKSKAEADAFVWNGKDKEGNAVPEGVYYYSLQRVNSKNYQGFIQLVR